MQRVPGLGSGALTDDGRAPAPAGQSPHQGLRVRAEVLLVEGQVDLLAAVGGKGDLGEVAVEPGRPVLPQRGGDAVQNALRGFLPLVRPQGAGIEMAEVHAGQQPLIQLA